MVENGEFRTSVHGLEFLDRSCFSSISDGAHSSVREVLRGRASVAMNAPERDGRHYTQDSPREAMISSFIPPRSSYGFTRAAVCSLCRAQSRLRCKTVVMVGGNAVDKIGGRVYVYSSALAEEGKGKGQYDYVQGKQCALDLGVTF